MYENDTIYLLKECNSGVKTAINSINEVLTKVRSHKLNSLLEETLRLHKKFGDDIHNMLSDYNEPGKEPNALARAMSWMTINFKFVIDPTDTKIAELMYDGCHMGIKSIYQYKNQYPNATEAAKSQAAQIIEAEKICMEELQNYL